ncbi:UDP-4-amino-4,6-dideoxy-N-acetyl-beta-L-altrosamine N-acetyltransferase [Lysinibacillus capsici]|uniref:UDP-4-amino-4, 6-dideoxy-N-acetyl-beta-L-altrosamine N-acetyltransferase n=1 Tax=Lysinibacillus capsici TaxID=2115968 RepID=UPI0028BDC532|nr:UDP-4-amino-4,6-dideoxy-N-acetyl-beta-L-altrosamine N-acetyltransferase [Lysinibacillus capsici]WNN76925.1 UDP-4-amino-4,6-dideoxy-N-acetyl-beta-L-altrosamine N-acetyltransferase [Lysinibacillus capsici]
MILLKMIGGESFLEFTLLSEEYLDLIMKWRTSEHVTKFMYTDIEPDLNKQKKWFEKINKDNTQLNWVIVYKDNPIGLISLNNIDYIHEKASSGFYIGELEYSIVSSRILPYFLNFYFFEMKFNKLVIEVLSINESMLKMDYHYGFRKVGTLTQHIKKDGIYYDVEVLEILKDTWMNNYQKYHKLKAPFESRGKNSNE